MVIWEALEGLWTDAKSFMDQNEKSEPLELAQKIFSQRRRRRWLAVVGRSAKSQRNYKNQRTFAWKMKRETRMWFTWIWPWNIQLATMAERTLGHTEMIGRKLGIREFWRGMRARDLCERGWSAAAKRGQRVIWGWAAAAEDEQHGGKGTKRAQRVELEQKRRPTVWEESEIIFSGNKFGWQLSKLI